MLKFFKGLGVLAAFGLLALMAGTLLPWPLMHQEETGGKTGEILVISNPIHTDIAIAATPESLKTFGFLKKSGLPLDAPGLRWIIFGWGGTWSQLKLVPAVKALTIDRSVMHVELAGEIDRSLPQVKSIPIPGGITRSGNGITGMEQIHSQIAASFLEEDPLAIPGAGYGLNDRFFEAKGGFNVLFGCNVWAARVLRAGGFRTGFWNPLPQSLVYSLELFNTL
jgi:uncharacterized protein (TIGR02117 family)